MLSHATTDLAAAPAVTCTVAPVHAAITVPPLLPCKPPLAHPAAVTYLWLLLLSLLSPQNASWDPAWISLGADELSWKLLGVEGSQICGEREKKKKKGKTRLFVNRSLSVPRGIFQSAQKLCPNLCLAQRAFKYGRGSLGVCVFPHFSPT